MLQSLELRDVGPAPKFDLELGPRLNVLTGDNGLGKTFFLDIAWWALTRTWARLPAQPQRGPDKHPCIRFAIRGASKVSEYTSEFDWPSQDWTGRGRGRPINPGMVIYAQVDGGFSVWDPARNYWRKRDGVEAPQRPTAYSFSASQVWDGLRDNGDVLCNGLIADWASWQRENGESFALLRTALRRLSAAPDELLEPGALTRLRINDVRDHPTLAMPYGQDVPLAHASAGMRRIVALAYLLVWTWQEHTRASELLNQPVARQIVFLIDEVEAHLHPRWQRRILAALLGVMDELTGTQDVPVQLITATHSPLVLASLEPWFDVNRDRLWTLDLERGNVVLTQSEWYRRGDANSWLTSDIFDLREPRSLEAEQAIQRALRLYLEDEPAPAEIVATNDALAAALPDIDPFWLRWRAFVDAQSRAQG